MAIYVGPTVSDPATGQVDLQEGDEVSVYRRYPEYGEARVVTEQGGMIDVKLEHLEE